MDINTFILKYVVKREQSLFAQDILDNRSQLYEKIKDKSVLVIGGAGSIGSSFIKQILPYEPKTLVVVDINENGLAELTRDIRSTDGLYIPQDYVTYPMDYASKVFEKMFVNRGGFDIVANFSAHKHVRSEKDVYSIEALLRNNVLSLKKLLDLMVNFPPEEYFCVSTDKAANPVNIMGASKRIMEDLIFLYSDRFPVKTARFANVAFSNGSLPAGFLERISKHQPLSAPKDVKRYFVSLEESGQICMLAGILGNNREIFYPKLKETQMMSFDSIATNLLKEYGYMPVKCSSDEQALHMMKDVEKDKYPVHYSVSDTSGEKEYEEFFVDGEVIDEKRFLALGVIVGKEIPNRKKLEGLCDRLEQEFASLKTSKENIVDILEDYLPNFKHIETGKSLDGKM